MEQASERLLILAQLKECSQSILRIADQQKDHDQTYDESFPDVAKLVYLLEKVLAHELQNVSFFSKTVPFHFESNLPQCLPDTGRFIDEIKQLDRDDIARGRIFVRLALNEKSFTDYLNALLFNDTLLRKYYSPNALLRHTEQASLMIDMLVQMEQLPSVQFNLNVKDERFADPSFYQVVGGLGVNRTVGYLNQAFPAAAQPSIPLSITTRSSKSSVSAAATTTMKNGSKASFSPPAPAAPLSASSTGSSCTSNPVASFESPAGTDKLPQINSNSNTTSESMSQQQTADVNEHAAVLDAAAAPVPVVTKVKRKIKKDPKLTANNNNPKNAAPIDDSASISNENNHHHQPQILASNINTSTAASNEAMLELVKEKEREKQEKELQRIQEENELLMQREKERKEEEERIQQIENEKKELFKQLEREREEKAKIEKELSEIKKKEQEIINENIEKNNVHKEEQRIVNSIIEKPSLINERKRKESDARRLRLREQIEKDKEREKEEKKEKEKEEERRKKAIQEFGDEWKQKVEPVHSHSKQLVLSLSEPMQKLIAHLKNEETGVQLTETQRQFTCESLVDWLQENSENIRSLLQYENNELVSWSRRSELLTLAQRLFDHGVFYMVDGSVCVEDSAACLCAFSKYFDSTIVLTEITNRDPADDSLHIKGSHNVHVEGDNNTSDAESTSGLMAWRRPRALTKLFQKKKKNSEKNIFSSTIAPSSNEFQQFPTEMPTKRPNWLPDECASCCCLCLKEFSLIVGRHHCRSCGFLFCGSCCKKKMKLPHLEYFKKVLVCNRCIDLFYTDTTIQLNNE